MVSEEYKKSRELVREAMENARKLAQDAFSKESREMLDKWDIDSFSWPQYTPYFNDGDVCVFHVNAYADYGIEINEHERDDYWHYNWETKEHTLREPDDNEDDWGDPIDRSAKTPPFEAYQDIENFLYQFDESDMLHMFGDHVRVTVTRNGISEEEYSHD